MLVDIMALSGRYNPIRGQGAGSAGPPRPRSPILGGTGCRIPVGPKPAPTAACIQAAFQLPCGRSTGQRSGQVFAEIAPFPPPYSLLLQALEWSCTTGRDLRPRFRSCRPSSGRATLELAAGPRPMPVRSAEGGRGWSRRVGSRRGGRGGRRWRREGGRICPGFPTLSGSWGRRRKAWLAASGFRGRSLRAWP